MTEIKEKACSKCGLVKPLTDFHVKKAQADGLNTQCKTCVCNYSKLYHRTRTKSAVSADMVRARTKVSQSKRCSRCREIKPLLTGFGVNTSKAGGFNAHCKACGSVSNKTYYQKNRQRANERSRKYAKLNEAKVKAWKREWSKLPKVQAQGMLNQARHRAKRRGIPFNITLDDIRLPAFCPILGIPLDYGFKEGHLIPSSPSLDRRDSAKGYVKGNVEVISMKANLIKTYATPEEIMLVARYVGLMS